MYVGACGCDSCKRRPQEYVFVPLLAADGTVSFRMSRVALMVFHFLDLVATSKLRSATVYTLNCKSVYTYTSAGRVLGWVTLAIGQHSTVGKERQGGKEQRRPARWVREAGIKFVGIVEDITGGEHDTIGGIGSGRMRT